MPPRLCYCSWARLPHSDAMISLRADVEMLKYVGLMTLTLVSGIDDIWNCASVLVAFGVKYMIGLPRAVTIDWMLMATS